MHTIKSKKNFCRTLDKRWTEAGSVTQ